MARPGVVTVELAIQTMTDFATSLELAEWAETEGLANFALADHYLTSPDYSSYALDQLTLLGAIAARTERIGLTTLVSPITFRHPAVMLKAAVTLDEISGGRFSLGVGAGWMKEEHDRFGFTFPDVGERFDRLTEALAYLKAVRGGNEEGFTGRYYQLAPGPSPRPLAETLRIVLGGSGARRTPALAGRYADEFNVFPSRDPMGPRIEAARQAARAAGRDPNAMLVSTAFPLVIGADTADLERRIETVAASRGGDPDRIRTRWRRAGIPVAAADDYRNHLEELEAEGISRVYFQVAFDTLDDIRHMVGLLKS